MSQPPPNVNYDDAVFAANTAKTVREEQKSGFIDRTYYRGIPAIIKLVECVLSLIAYICVSVTADCAYITTFGFFKFVTMGALVLTIFLWLGLLLKVPQRCLRCNCVNWPYFEMGFYAVIVIFYFFADLFLALHGCRGGHKAGVAFGFFALGAYVVDFVFSFRVWWAVRKEQKSSVESPVMQPDEARVIDISGMSHLGEFDQNMSEESRSVLPVEL